MPVNKRNKEDYPDMSDDGYWESRQNLFGLFSLLLEIDKRINPHLYKKPKIKYY